MIYNIKTYLLYPKTNCVCVCCVLTNVVLCSIQYTYALHLCCRSESLGAMTQLSKLTCLTVSVMIWASLAQWWESCLPSLSSLLALGFCASCSSTIRNDDLQGHLRLCVFLSSRRCQPWCTKADIDRQEPIPFKNACVYVGARFWASMCFSCPCKGCNYTLCCLGMF